MKTIYVVGGNGFAKECYNYIRILSEKTHEIQFGGFLGHNGYVVDFFDLNGFFKGDVAESEGMVCGGIMKVLVEDIPLDVYDD